MARLLVVVTGPIASGKTDVARSVAAKARRRGQTAAAIDMDNLVHAVGEDWLDVRPDDWVIAREMASGIAETLFLHEIETVIISGPFFNEESRQDLLRGFAIEPPALFIMLRVSLDESKRRAVMDATREQLTKDPALIERIYETIDWENLPEQDVDIDTDGLTLDEVIALVAEQVLA